MATRLQLQSAILFLTILFLIVTGLSQSALATCQDMKLCHIDPATGRQTCRVFKNVCSIVPLSGTEAAPQVHNRSIELRGLSDDELKQVIDKLGVDQNRIKMP
jgi:hypothetical protein